MNVVWKLKTPPPGAGLLAKEGHGYIRFKESGLSFENVNYKWGIDKLMPWNEIESATIKIGLLTGHRVLIKSKNDIIDILFNYTLTNSGTFDSSEKLGPAVTRTYTGAYSVEEDYKYTINTFLEILRKKNSNILVDGDQ